MKKMFDSGQMYFRVISVSFMAMRRCRRRKHDAGIECADLMWVRASPG